MKRRFPEIIADCGGGALVEFAIVLPLMILLLVGFVELVAGYDAQRKLEHVAYAVADVVSQSQPQGQQPAITFAQLADVISGGQSLMSPLPADSTTLTQVVGSVTADATGHPRVDWVYPAGSTLTVGNGVLQPNQSMIVAQATYLYTPFSSFIWASGTTLTFQKQSYLEPRYMRKVPAPTS